MSLVDKGMLRQKATIWYLGFNYTFMTNIIFPALPGIQNLYQLSSTELSLMASAPALINLIFQPFAGRLSDRLNRAHVVLLGLLAYALGASISAVVLLGAGIYGFVLLGRTIMGFGELGAFPQYLALMREWLPAGERQAAMGRMEAYTSLGGTVAPSLGGYLAGGSLSLPFGGSAIAALVAIVIFRFYGLGTRQKQKKMPVSEVAEGETLPGKPKFHYGYLGGAFLLGTLVVLQTFIGSFMDQEYGFTMAQIGFTLAIVPLLMALGSSAMAWAGAAWTKNYSLAAIGLVGLIGIWATAWSFLPGFTLLGLGCIGFVLGFWLPVFDHDVAEAGSAATSGARLSIFQQSKALGILIMPLLSGLAIDVFKSFRPALTLLGVSFLLLGSLTLYLRSKSQALPIVGGGGR